MTSDTKKAVLDGIRGILDHFTVWVDAFDKFKRERSHEAAHRQGHSIAPTPGALDAATGDARDARESMTNAVGALLEQVSAWGLPCDHIRMLLDHPSSPKALCGSGFWRELGAIGAVAAAPDGVSASSTNDIHALDYMAGRFLTVTFRGDPTKAVILSEDRTGADERQWSLIDMAKGEVLLWAKPLFAAANARNISDAVALSDFIGTCSEEDRKRSYVVVNRLRGRLACETDAPPVDLGEPMRDRDAFFRELEKDEARRESAIATWVGDEIDVAAALAHTGRVREVLAELILLNRTIRARDPMSALPEAFEPLGQKLEAAADAVRAMAHAWGLSSHAIVRAFLAPHDPTRLAEVPACLEAIERRARAPRPVLPSEREVADVVAAGDVGTAAAVLANWAKYYIAVGPLSEALLERITAQGRQSVDRLAVVEIDKRRGSLSRLKPLVVLCHTAGVEWGAAWADSLLPYMTDPADLPVGLAYGDLRDVAGHFPLIKARWDAKRGAQVPVRPEQKAQEGGNVEIGRWQRDDFDAEELLGLLAIARAEDKEQSLAALAALAPVAEAWQLPSWALTNRPSVIHVYTDEVVKFIEQRAKTKVPVLPENGDVLPDSLAGLQVAAEVAIGVGRYFREIGPLRRMWLLNEDWERIRRGGYEIDRRRSLIARIRPYLSRCFSAATSWGMQDADKLLRYLVDQDDLVVGGYQDDLQDVLDLLMLVKARASANADVVVAVPMVSDRTRVPGQMLVEFDPDGHPVVCGIRKARLNGTEEEAVKKLIAAGDEGASLETDDRDDRGAYVLTDAERKALGRMMGDDDHWEMAIRKAGSRGKRWKIRTWPQ